MTRTPPCRVCQGEGTEQRAYSTAACEHCLGAGECDCRDCTEDRAEREACGDLA
jgi:hypothetical protein